MSKELKQQILNEIAAGATAQQCADKYNIPAGTIRSWVSREKKRSAARGKSATKNAAQRNGNRSTAQISKKKSVEGGGDKKTFQNKPHDKNICGAKGKQSGLPCRRPAGWGTSHPGKGRCKLHGGCSTGPKDATGNKNAVKHGAYETIIRDRLSDTEKAVFDAISDDSNMSQEIKILRFKMLRLLDPVEKQVAMGTELGPEIVTLQVDEVTKAYALEKLVDGIRKIVKDTKDTIKEEDTVKIVDDVDDANEMDDAQ